MKSIRSMIRKYKHKAREKKVLKSCGCACYCPSCKDILNDQADCTDTDLVRYKCNTCGHKSEWNFDICMIPIEMSSLVYETQSKS